MEYRGYTLKPHRFYYEVTAPSGLTWTEDTLQDAEKAIDEMEDGNGNSTCN